MSDRAIGWNPISGQRSAELEELLAEVDRVGDQLEALAREAEIDGRPPAALGALMKASRFSMAKVPKELGGYELSPGEQVDYFAHLAYRNPTAAWLSFNQNGIAGMLGAILPDAGVERLFADGAPLAAAVAAPTGTSVRVEGGYRVTGRWSYASGVHVAEWIGITTICDDPAGPRLVALPTDQVQLVGEWEVAALQGTGSVDVVVDDVFVPDEMTAFPMMRLRGGRQFTHLGMRGYVAGENLGFSLGVAQRLLDDVARLAATKKRVMNPNTVGDRGAFQQELGRADSTIRAARAYMISELDAAMRVADETDEPLSADDRMRLEAALSWTTQTVVEAAMKVFPYAGASALQLDNPIQRCLRDLIGSGQHLVATSESLDMWGAALVQRQK